MPLTLASLATADTAAFLALCTRKKTSVSISADDSSPGFGAMGKGAGRVPLTYRCSGEGIEHFGRWCVVLNWWWYRARESVFVVVNAEIVRVFRRARKRRREFRLLRSLGASGWDWLLGVVRSRAARVMIHSKQSSVQGGEYHFCILKKKTKENVL